MTARTFGRKGSAAGAVAPRRAAFVARSPEPADRPTESEVVAPPPSPAAAAPETVTAAPEPVFVGGKSLTTAYALWLGLGLAGGHRFYLGRPLTGAIQAVLFLASLALAAAEYYLAFFGLVASGLWMFADGFLIRRMHSKATWR